MLVLEHRCAFEVAVYFALLSRFPVCNTQLIFEIAKDPHFPDDVLVKGIIDCRYILDEEVRHYICFISS